MLHFCEKKRADAMRFPAIRNLWTICFSPHISLSELNDAWIYLKQKKPIFNNDFIWNACIENTFIFICLFDLLKISIRYKMRKKSQYATFTGFHRLHSWRFWFVHQGLSSIYKLTIKVIFISNVELFFFKNSCLLYQSASLLTHEYN